LSNQERQRFRTYTVEEREAIARGELPTPYRPGPKPEEKAARQAKIDQIDAEANAEEARLDLLSTPKQEPRGFLVPDRPQRPKGFRLYPFLMLLTENFREGGSWGDLEIATGYSAGAFNGVITKALQGGFLDNLGQYVMPIGRSKTMYKPTDRCFRAHAELSRRFVLGTDENDEICLLDIDQLRDRVT